jgi:O-antigen/teichoic acid export membrane protein
MGIIKKQSINSSLVQGAGIVFSVIQLLIIFPAFLSKGEIGVIRLFIDLSFITAPLFLMGASAIYLKYYYQFKDSEAQTNSLKLIVILLNLVGFISFTLLLWLLNPFFEDWMKVKSPEFIPYLKFVPILGFLVSIFQLLRGFHQVSYRLQLANFLEYILGRVLLAGLAVAVFYADLNYNQIIASIIGCYAILAAIQVIAYLKVDTININRSWRNEIPDPQMRSMLVYGLFTFMIAVTDGVVIKLDTWMISSLDGVEAVGVYAIALQLGMLVEFPKRSISLIAKPLIAKEWAANNMNEIHQIYKRTSLVQLIFGGLIFSLVFLNIDSFYKIIPNGGSFSGGKWVVFFIGLGKWFAISTGSNIEILQLSPYYKHTFWIRFSLLLTAIITNLLLIPIFGIAGAAIATALTLFTHNTIISTLVWIKLRIHPFTTKSVQAFLVFAFSFGVASLIPTVDFIVLDVALRSLILGILVLGLLYYLKVSEDVFGLLKSVTNRKSKKD